MATTDQGPKPYVANIEDLTLENDKFRQAAWTGSNLQLTLMSIAVGGEIGLEKHDDLDQFLRIEQGRARVVMGSSKDHLEHEWEASGDFMILIPGGTWHNVHNIGDEPLKIYSLYAPPEHPHGTVHETYEEAMEAELAHHH